MNGLLVKTKKLQITKNAQQIVVDICLNKRNRKGDNVDDVDHNLGKKKKVMNSIRILTSWISAQNVTTYFIIDPNHQTKWKGWEPPLPPREKR